MSAPKSLHQFYNRLIKDLFRRRILHKQIPELLCDMKQNNFKPNNIMKQFMIRNCILGQNYQHLIEIVKDQHGLTFDFEETNMIFHGLASNFKMKEIWYTLQILHQRGIPIDINGYNIVLKTIARSPKEYIKEIHELIHVMTTINNVNPNTETFNHLIQLSNRARNFPTAIEYFQMIDKTNNFKNVRSYNMLLDTYGRQGKIDIVFDLYKAIFIDNDVDLISKIIHNNNNNNNNSHIHNNNNKNKNNSVNSKLMQLKSKGLNILPDDYVKDKISIKPDFETFEVLIYSCGIVGDIEKAFNIYDDIVTNYDNNNTSNRNKNPSSSSLSSPEDEEQVYIDDKLLKALLNVCVKCNNGEKAIFLIQDVYKQNLMQLQAQHFVLAMKACGNEGKWLEAVELSNAMKKMGISLDLMSCNMLIDISVKCNQFPQALQTVDDMYQAGIQPDVVTYNTLLHGASLSNLWDKSKEILASMQENGVKPDTQTFNTFIDGCYKHNEDYDINDMLEIMNSSGITYDSTTYNMIIKNCIKSQKFDDAEEIFKNLKDDNNSIYNFNTMISGFVRTAASIHKATELFQFMKLSSTNNNNENNNSNKNYIKPDIVTYNTMLYGYRKHKKYDDFLKTYQELNENVELKKDIVTYSETIRFCCETDSFNDLPIIYEECVTNGIKPTSYILNSTLKFYLRHRRYENISELINLQASVWGNEESSIDNVVNLLTEEKTINLDGLEILMNILLLKSKDSNSNLNIRKTTFDRIINALLKDRYKIRFHTAMSLVKVMHLRGMFADEETYNNLLQFNKDKKKNLNVRLSLFSLIEESFMSRSSCSSSDNNNNNNNNNEVPFIVIKLLCDHYIETKKWNKAIEVIQSIGKTDDNNRPTIVRYYEKVFIQCLKQNNHKELIDIFESVNNPNFFENRYKIKLAAIESYLELENFEKARNLFNQVDQEFNEFRNVENMDAANSHTANALEGFRYQLKDLTNFSKIRRQRCFQLIQTGELDRADTYIRKVYDTSDFEEGEVVLQLSNYLILEYIKRKQFNEALEISKLIANEDKISKDAEFYKLSVKIILETGDCKFGEEIFDQIHELNIQDKIPNYSDFLFSHYISQQKWNMAFETAMNILQNHLSITTTKTTATKAILSRIAIKGLLSLIFESKNIDHNLLLQSMNRDHIKILLNYLHKENTEEKYDKIEKLLSQIKTSVGISPEFLEQEWRRLCIKKTKKSSPELFCSFFIKGGLWDKALIAFKDILKANEIPSFERHGDLLVNLIHEKRWKDAELVLNTIREKENFDKILYFEQIINGYSYNQDIINVQRLLKQISQNSTEAGYMICDNIIEKYFKNVNSTENIGENNESIVEYILKTTISSNNNNVSDDNDIITDNDQCRTVKSFLFQALNSQKEGGSVVEEEDISIILDTIITKCHNSECSYRDRKAIIDILNHTGYWDQARIILENEITNNNINNSIEYNQIDSSSLEEEQQQQYHSLITTCNKSHEWVKAAELIRKMESSSTTSISTTLDINKLFECHNDNESLSI